MSVWGILLGLVFGAIGFWVIREGRRLISYPLIFAGLALVLFPYFITNPWQIFFIGVGLCFLAYHFRKNS